MEEKIIRYVSIYLRKSRGDEDTALDKHKLVLRELCLNNNWKYVEYEEIVSGDSISMRPIFTKLLTDIESGIYDACCVMDIDRLGRGNQSDQGKINQAFTSSNTYIVTPQQIYNLNNDDDEFVVDMKSFISRREYKQIVKRLSQGKKIGSRQGNWTNGTPPFPYEYERYKDKYNHNGIVVNDEKLKIYRIIINSVINENMTPKQIAVKLNNLNVPSPRNSYWHGNTVNRIIIDETHLGKIIANKTRGDGHAKKKQSAKDVEYLPKDKWVVVNNCHEAVKTQEEHETILIFMSRLTKAPKRTQQIILPLSGMVKCGICGHTMGVYSRGDRDNQHTLKPCWYTDKFGNKCGNSGTVLDGKNSVYEKIKERIYIHLDEMIEQSKNSDINENKLLIEQQISYINNDIESKNKSLERILDAFENGLYTIEQFKERKSKIDAAIVKLIEDKNILEIKINQFNSKLIDEKIKKLQNFKTHINDQDISDIDKNNLYKSIIEYIVWTKNGDEFDFHIEYL
jgi:DNA invertase Pin-like site-specific DNA recombinase